MNKIYKIYEILYKRFGAQHWWPGETPFEVMVGAVLTQNTAWKNVEKAIINLKSNRLMDCRKIGTATPREIETCIRPTGFYKQKTYRLIKFCQYLEEHYQSDLKKFFARDTETVRNELLSLNGIGEETADSILLYAGDKLKFVIDAYTRRICKRIGITSTSNYAKLQELFEKNIPEDIEIYKEYHALLVELGKNYCRKKPLCNKCPVKKICAGSGE